MSDLRAALIKAFLETESFKFDPEKGFKLSSGERSKYYVDCKNLMSYPEYRKLVAQLAFQKVRELQFQCIGGLEIGAIAIATAISDLAHGHQYDWRTFVVRKKSKEHGLERLIEGKVETGERVLIVDDVLTTGRSILDAVKAVRATGLTVTKALVIVDREEKNGRQNLADEKVELLSLLSIKDLQKSFEPALT